MTTTPIETEATPEFSANEVMDRAPGELWAGDVAEAEILALAGDGLRVRVGSLESVVPVAALVAPGGTKPAVGERVSVFIDELDPLTVSHEKALKLRTFEALSAAAEGHSEIEGTVVASVTGGLAVDVGIKGFLPASEAGLRRTHDLDQLVGERLRFKILRWQAKRGNLVLSRKAVLEEEREALRKATLAGLAVGQVRTGTVKSLTTYGAFVDLGGLDGLLHVTDMSWGHVGHPGQVVKVGDEVKVSVLKLDAENGRVSLGTKQLTEDPWTTVPQRFSAGTEVMGKVARLTDFGAFVELAPCVDGLVHASELTWARGKKPSEVVKVGQSVRARVLEVNTREHRISLSLKQLQPDPWRVFADAHPRGAQVVGPVRSITDFGVFVRVSDDLDGLVHVSDMSWTERPDPHQQFKKGDEVTAVVLDVDVPNQRIALGLKQLTEDPWVALARRHPRGSKLTGKVVRVVDFGVFIEVEPGIDGLCHISELARDRVEKTSDVAKVGDELEVMVLDIATRERKISLSVKAALENDTSYREKLGDTDEGASGFRNSLGDKLASKLGKS